MTKINEQDLVAAIRSMTPQQKIFKILQKELRALGYWRNLPRGNPSKGYKVMKENKKKVQL